MSTTVTEEEVSEYEFDLREEYDVGTLGQIHMEKAVEIACSELPFERTTFFRRMRQSIPAQEMGQYRMVDLSDLARAILRWSKMGFPDPRSAHGPR